MACKNVRDSYKLYKQLENNIVELKKYIIYANEFNKFLIDKVLNGDEVTLPARFGTLSIIGKKENIKFDENGKVKGLAPDWVKTKELWNNNPKAKEEKKLLYHTNSHTDNTRYKVFWSKQRILIQNKILYSLRITRTNKRNIHNLILKNKQYKTK